MSPGIRAAAVGAAQALLRPSTQLCSKCRPRPAMPRCSETWRNRHPMQITPRLISASSDVFAYDTATAVFTGFNTLLLFPWTLMVFVPNLDFTRSLIKSNIFLYIFCLMFTYLFAAATAEALRAGASLSDEVQFLFLEAVAGSNILLMHWSPQGISDDPTSMVQPELNIQDCDMLTVSDSMPRAFAR